MSTFDRYEMPTDPDWQVPSGFETNFRWEYDDGRSKLLGLYRKGKKNPGLCGRGRRGAPEGR